MPTIEELTERVSKLEFYLGFGDEPEAALDNGQTMSLSRIEQLRDMYDMPMMEVIPSGISADIDVRPGILEAQRVGVAFMSEPGRVEEDLTAGEFWWCIQRGYAVLAGDPANQEHVGIDPPGSRPPMLESQWLTWLRHGAIYWAWYYGHVMQPLVEVPTGPIDWSSLPYSTGGGGK